MRNLYWKVAGRRPPPKRTAVQFTCDASVDVDQLHQSLRHVRARLRLFRPSSLPSRLRFLACSCWSSGRNCGHTKAQEAVPVLRLAPAPARRTAVPGGTDPAAAPDHPARAGRWPLRIIRWRAGVVVTTIPVLAPLPHIPVHVVQAERIRFLQARLMRVSLSGGVRVFNEPSMLPKLRRIVAEGIHGRRSSPTGVLPLRLGHWPGLFMICFGADPDQDAGFILTPVPKPSGYRKLQRLHLLPEEPL